MISSTVRDLPLHREKVLDACLRQGFFPKRMEDLPAVDADAIAASLALVDEATVYLGIFAYRYGHVPDGHDISITEMEYDRAVERDIHRLIFLMSDDHPIKPSDVERGEGSAKIDRLRSELEKERVVKYFDSPDALLADVIHALGDLKQDLGLIDVKPLVDEDRALAAFRESVFERYRWADTSGLFLREKEGAGEGIALEDVFVETWLKKAPEQKTAKRKTADKDLEDEDTEDERERDKREREFGPSPFDEPPDAGAELRTISEVLPRERLTVILGPPGSGKSTLMRCLAMALCRPLDDDEWIETGLPPETVPLLYELRRFASALRQQPSLELDNCLLEHFRSQLPNIDELLESDRALVLLDGLDEVFDEDHRRWVRDEVWRLAARFRRARFVLTSRPLGYRAAPLPGPVPLWWVAPFDDEQVGTFFRGWFEALAHEGVESTKEQTPVDRAQRLTADILNRQRIRNMARNPLLCTLIVMVHRSRSGHLPRRRFVFYEAAVHTMVEFWERAKRAPKQEYEFPEPELVTRALAETAWRAFHELESREIPEADLRRWLEESFADDPDWSGARGRRAVRDFLKLVQERTGLLIDAGGDRYQFVHLSLHEYLIARYILDRLDQEVSERVLRHYLHDPQWSEVNQLLVAGAPEVRSEGLVRVVLEAPSSEWETRLRRDLRFLCRCLGDRAQVGAEVRKEVYAEVEAALESEEETFDWWELASDASYAGMPAAQAAARRRLADDSVSVRSAAVDYFAKLGLQDAETRAAVTARLADDSWSVRSAAVEYFAKLGLQDAETRAAVTARLADDSVSVRSAAVDYFAKLGLQDAETRAAVTARLADDYLDVRSAAVEYFAKLGLQDAETRAAFTARLADDYLDVRSAAVEYFAKLGLQDAETRAAVTARLADDDEDVRSAAVEYFAKLGLQDAETRAAVTARLADDYLDVRRAAVEYFAKLGLQDAETRAAVTARLADDDWSVRSAAVEYFAKLGLQDAETRAAVTARLADDYLDVRSAAVEYFAKLGLQDAETRAAFTARLTDDDEDVRSAAVEYFAAMGFEAPLVLKILGAFGTISSNTSVATDRLIGEHLGKAAASDPELLATVLREGSKVQFFKLGRFLSAAALELDRLCRQQNKPHLLDRQAPRSST